MLNLNQVSVLEDKALLCLHITPLWPAWGGAHTPRIWGNNLVQKHRGPSSWVAHSSRPIMRPCFPITKWESGQVTLKGLSNMTGNFYFKSSFNLFHYIAKGSLACSMTSRKEAGFQGYFAPGTPLPRDFPDKSGNRHPGLEIMPQILEGLKAQTRGQKLYCLLPWWLRE